MSAMNLAVSAASPSRVNGPPVVLTSTPLLSNRPLREGQSLSCKFGGTEHAALPDEVERSDRSQDRSPLRVSQ